MSKKLYRIKNFTTGKYLTRAYRHRAWNTDHTELAWKVQSFWDEGGKVFQTKSGAQGYLTRASGMFTKDRKTAAQRVLNMNAEYANVFVVETILSDGDIIK